MEKCAEQQRLLFLGMCSLEDRKRICDEKIMDLYNFEWITYLLEAFGFEEYKFVFEMKYKDLLLKLADIVEQNLVCGNSMDKIQHLSDKKISFYFSVPRITNSPYYHSLLFEYGIKHKNWNQVPIFAHNPLLFLCHTFFCTQIY